VPKIPLLDELVQRRDEELQVPKSPSQSRHERIGKLVRYSHPQCDAQPQDLDWRKRPDEFAVFVHVSRRPRPPVVRGETSRSFPPRLGLPDIVVFWRKRVLVRENGELSSKGQLVRRTDDLVSGQQRFYRRKYSDRRDNSSLVLIALFLAS
jgi:hypothetical protein